MYLERKLIPRGKKLYLVQLYEEQQFGHRDILGRKLYIECLIKDNLGTVPIMVDGNVYMFLPIGYRRNAEFPVEERLKAYVHFNNLVSLFRDHKIYGDVT